MEKRLIASVTRLVIEAVKMVSFTSRLLSSNSGQTAMKFRQTAVIAKTVYDKIVNSPQNVKSLSVLSPVLGVGTNAFAIYQV